MNGQKSLKIYTLANPRGVHFFCEVCNRNATTICPACRVTYYCSEKHRQVDLESIHEEVCSFLSILRNTPASKFTMNSDTSVTSNFKNTLLVSLHLISLTTIKAKEYLFEEQYLKALPAAVHSLHFNNQLHGSDSLENVCSLLLITEAKLGMGNVELARQIFAQAEWMTKGAISCPDETLSHLYRTLAKINFVLGNFPKVKHYSSKDIYYCCKKYGPISHHTAGGYFQLGLSFEKQGKMEVARSLFMKVSQKRFYCWFNQTI
ncbi:hypothetical protein HELRODRAFT_64420 [Helobdella robusta]|uniref:MYND-type domain-containing protein n=1 Tax=Helobdella robusta TaxID=6412 RepID=T1FXU4_HELRO|nr:hypothetical protein HELRODRAFT_64420 [Helobdella robusta]ESO06124.1 hypothetical protein HELRODRAFT_64420 [Helobdella robusta]